ncbi:hypothetical protein BSKO_11366 [Bryopsis sp. KO-2023]|nr:hypothetical protein BSKO_11366 [Bryopsis sp. KO-2023]
MESRAATCEKVRRETQANMISSYNFGPVMSVQGTIGLEILDQIPSGVDAVVVPVSGGGLLAGVLIAIKSIHPDIKVIAAEPTGTNNAADLAKSMQAGELVDCPFPKTAADGLMGKPGDLTWPIIRDLVDGVVTVSEEEILHAVQLCYEKLKVAVEPSGAVSLAAVLSREFKSNPAYACCSRICLVVSGGNVDLEGKGFWDMTKWPTL